VTVLIAGSHGFIGFSVARRLLDAGHAVIGVDKMRDAVSPKGARVEILHRYSNYKFIDLNLADHGSTRELFERQEFDHAVFLAGQYSQSHSEKHVAACMQGNVIAINNVFEAAARKGLSRVIYASSTFVQDGVLPKTFYGLTKEWAERCASVYSEQTGLQTIGLRFGSVYGPHVRPDVGISHAAKHLFKGHEIDISKGGYTYRVAFTFIDDAVECVVRFLELPQVPKLHQVFTIVAEDETRDMVHVLDYLEKHSGKKAKRVGTRLEQQPHIPLAECAAVREAIGYAPATKMDEGVAKFVEWYRSC